MPTYVRAEPGRARHVVTVLCDNGHLLVISGYEGKDDSERLIKTRWPAFREWWMGLVLRWRGYDGA